MPPQLNGGRHTNGPKPPQLDSLTSLRGIAAWWVVLFHFQDYMQPYIPEIVYRIIGKGYLAVDLFFCLSGFVIFLNYGSLNLGNAVNCGTFYLKRIAKIYPLHISVLALYLGLVAAIMLLHHNIPTEKYSADSFVLSLFLLQDWNTLSYLSWNVPAWSISAEFAAYLVFPLLVVVVRPVISRLWASGLVVAGALLLLNAFYAPVGFNLAAEVSAFGVIRCVCQFTIGAVLAAIFMRGIPDRRIVAALFVIAPLLFIAGLYTFQSIFIPLACAALVLAVAATDAASNVLRIRFLVFVGEISYATYMVHYLVKDIFKLGLVHENELTPPLYLALAFAVIIVGSVVLYRYVEKPAQKMIVRSVLA